MAGVVPDEVAQSSELLVAESERMPSARDSVVAVLAEGAEVTTRPAFRGRRIVTRQVPVLGAVTCHRKMVPALRTAMRELSRRRLARLVDPGDYAGCYAPRRIRPGGALSLHAWGLAVDLNARANPFGGRSRQDRRLVRVMERHGFTWGGGFPTTPDPMHFEFRGRLAGAATR